MYASPTDKTYNSIRRIECQLQWLSKARAALLELARIFVKHLVHDKFSIILIHRHQDMKPGYVMVGEWIDEDTLHTAIERDGIRNTYPSAYLVEKTGGLAAFEFSTSQTCPPPEPFAAEVRNYILQRGLEEILGLGASAPSSSEWLERLLDDDRGTVAKPMRHDMDDEHRTNSVVTEWSIDRIHPCEEPKHKAPHGLDTPRGSEVLTEMQTDIQVGPRTRCIVTYAGHKQEKIW